MSATKVPGALRRPRGGAGFGGLVRRAFTLVELLVLMAIIVILLALLMPALDQARQRAMTVRCMSNLRQMNAAWHLYTSDNKELVPPNNPGQMDWFEHWVNGWFDAEAFTSDNTNLFLLTDSRLWPYLRSFGVWRCPADKSTMRIPQTGELVPRVRSVSINNWLGTDYIWNREDGGDAFKAVHKTIELTSPSPAETYVCLDEREDSINDGYYVVSMTDTGPNCHIVDFPGCYHRRGANFVFADGHWELMRWRDPRTTPPIQDNVNLELNVESPNNPDVLWLQNHATGKK